MNPILSNFPPPNKKAFFKRTEEGFINPLLFAVSVVFDPSGFYYSVFVELTLTANVDGVFKNHLYDMTHIRFCQ